MPYPAGSSAVQAVQPLLQVPNPLGRVPVYIFPGILVPGIRGARFGELDPQTAILAGGQTSTAADSGHLRLVNTGHSAFLAGSHPPGGGVRGIGVGRVRKDVYPFARRMIIHQLATLLMLEPHQSPGPPLRVRRRMRCTRTRRRAD